MNLGKNLILKYLTMKIMTFYYKSCLNYKIVAVLFFFLFFSGTINAFTRANKVSESVVVNMSIADNNGKIISNAKIKNGEDIICSSTNKDGLYSFTANSDDIVTLLAPGFEIKFSSVKEIMNDNIVELNHLDLSMSLDEDIPLPYMTDKKRYLTGSYNVIEGDDLEKYPSTDLRLSLIGKAPGLQITEMHSAPGSHPGEWRGIYGSTEKVTISARGRNLNYVVDGVPANFAEVTLNPGEIESITVIKDIVGKAMYGPLGADGILFIKTKRGKPGENRLNVNLESGVNVIDRFPQWVGGADYARLHNQARLADGFDQLYNDNDIAEYAKNDPYDLVHPSVDYHDYMLKDTRVFQRANISARGGSENAQYASFIGFNREGDIFKIGSTADYNRINLRSNLDVDITDRISVEIDINGRLGIRNSPAYGYATSDGSSLMEVYEFNGALPFIQRTPPVEFPVYANNDPNLSQPWYARSNRYNNPIGEYLGSGDYSEQNRQAGARLALNYDLSQIVDGLESQTNFGFDVLNLLRIGQANRYEGYGVNVQGNDTTFSRIQTGIHDDTRRKLHDYYFIRTVFSQNFNYKKSFGVHDIESSLTYFAHKKIEDKGRRPEVQLLGVWTANYIYNNRYIFNGVLNYDHTYSFSKSSRNQVFPSIGAGWIVSEEDFMPKDGFLNYLKLRTELGVMGYNSYLNPYVLNSRFVGTTRASFGPHDLNRWFGTTVETSPPSTYPSWVGNPNLAWEKRREFNLGIEGQMINNKLFAEVSYYNTIRDDIIGRQSNSLPDITGMSGALPYVNYMKYKYYGVETGLNYRDQIGKLELAVDGYLTYQNSERLIFDEPNYREEYQFRTGRSIDTYWGLKHIGQFSSDEEALKIPQLFDAVLHEGDFKYADMNGDGVVDEDDVTAIGNTIPRIFYSLNLNLKYSNFELSVIGTGASQFDIPMTSRYFRSGGGDDNYSVFIRDNNGGDYPKLTYETVNNNFRPSSFWLMKGDYFKIKNVELAYTISGDKLNSIKSKGIRVFVRAANILTISSVKDIDPESPNSGISSYPLNKTFTGGISLTF